MTPHEQQPRGALPPLRGAPPGQGPEDLFGLPVRDERGGGGTVEMTVELRPKGHQVGDTRFGFVCVRRARGWVGPYGQSYSGARWRCETCGTHFVGDLDKHLNERLYQHMMRGHSPCGYCGAVLLNRMDGTPRQHAANRCPGKTEGHRIEREFVKNMSVREFR